MQSPKCCKRCNSKNKLQKEFENSINDNFVFEQKSFYNLTPLSKKALLELVSIESLPWPGCEPGIFLFLALTLPLSHGGSTAI